MERWRQTWISSGVGRTGVDSLDVYATPKPKFPNDLEMVGATGFEPVTSTV